MALTQTEIDNRVAILKRLKENLSRQRDKFTNYLRVLEEEGKSILAGDVEKLELQVNLEKNIVNEIYTFQKVINPLEDMYRMAYPAREDEIAQLKNSLNSLQEEVLEQNSRNRKLLKERMLTLKDEIKSVQLPFKGKSVYRGNDTASPRLVDIST